MNSAHFPRGFLYMGNIHMGERNSAGKGDKYRSVDMNKYRENYDKIFAKKKKKNSNSKKEKKNDG